MLRDEFAERRILDCLSLTLGAHRRCEAFGFESEDEVIDDELNELAFFCRSADLFSDSHRI